MSAVKARAPKGLKPVTVTTDIIGVTVCDVEVEIDPDTLIDEGWHHESQCGGRAVVSGLGAALASLHRQAHPSQPRDVMFCREEPCRSLTMDQLQEVDR